MPELLGKCFCLLSPLRHTPYYNEIWRHLPTGTCQTVTWKQIYLPQEMINSWRSWWQRWKTHLEVLLVDNISVCIIYLRLLPDSYWIRESFSMCSPIYPVILSCAYTFALLSISLCALADICTFLVLLMPHVLLLGLWYHGSEVARLFRNGVSFLRYLSHVVLCFDVFGRLRTWLKNRNTYLPTDWVCSFKNGSSVQQQMKQLFLPYFAIVKIALESSIETSSQ